MSANLYLDDFKVNERRSLSDAARNVETLRAKFGLWKAIDITTDAVTAYTARRLTPAPPAKPVRPATVNRELSALKRMFMLAIRAGKLASRPHVPLLAENNAREGFLEPADFAVLAHHLPAWLADAATFAISHRLAPGRDLNPRMARSLANACSVESIVVCSRTLALTDLKLEGEPHIRPSCAPAVRPAPLPARRPSPNEKYCAVE